MIYILLGLSVIISAIVIYLCLFCKKIRFPKKVKLSIDDDKDNKFYVVMRILCWILIAAVAVRLVNNDVIAAMVKRDILFSTSMATIVIVIRALTMGAVLACAVVSYFNYRSLRNIVAFFVPIIYIVNILFFTQNIQAMLGIVKVPTYNYREIVFAIECVLGVVIGLSFLVKKIKDRDFSKMYLQLPIALFTLIGFSLANMHPCSIENMWGTDWCGASTNFNRMHIYIIIGMLIVTVLLIALFKKLKNDDMTHCFLCICSVCCAMVFTANRDYANFKFWNLPLHLCNTGVFLMLFSFTCRNKPIFYFNYLVNVVGTLFAIILPDYGAALFSDPGIHYWHNHLLLFILPLVAVGAGYYERPKLKYIYYSMVVFTIYFLLVCFINAWFKNFEPGVNYFYLNGDTIVNRFVWAPHLKNDFIFVFKIQNCTFEIYWLYWLLTYVIYIGFIFVAWFGFVALYKVSDGYTDLIVRNHKIGEEHSHLMHEMKGRKLSEPLHPEDKDMIKISHFTKVYNGSSNKSVDDFSLQIHGGEVYGFLGHNGAGKSTTIKSLVGIQTITSGTMEVCGFDVERQPLQAKRVIGYVSDNHTVYENLTGREYINYVADLYLVAQAERDERITKYVKMFNLEDAIDREIKGYSHGMKQKIVVIASLIHNPKIWILDEPLTGLDPSSSFQIKSVMKEYANNGNIVFFSSHVIEVVEKICDKICIINHGKLVGEWALKDLSAHGETLQDLYMKYVSINKEDN